MQHAARQDIREILLSEYSRRRTRNPRYSMRSFARDLKLNITTLSQFFASRRSLSSESLERVIQVLEVGPREAAKFRAQQREKHPTSAQDTLLLEEEQFRLISDWYFIAILNLAKLPTPPSSPEAVAQRLGISVLEAREAIRILLDFGFLARRHGKLRRTVLPLSMLKNIPSAAVRRFHRGCLNLAQSSLDHDPIEERDFSTTMLVLDKRKLLKARRFIAEFRNRFLAEFEKPSKGTKEVYGLGIQLFPISHTGKKQ